MPYIKFAKDTYYSNYGSDSVKLTIVRRGDIKSKSSVLINTRENTAISGIDYQAVSEYLTFEPGETEKSISIPLMTTNTEDSKSFYVYMAYSEGADIEDNNRAKVILRSNAIMMRSASSGGDDSQLYFELGMGSSVWKEGVTGKYTEANITEDNLQLEITAEGWGWDEDKYDVSVVTQSSYDLTGYESVIVDWKNDGDDEEPNTVRLFISEQTNGDRTEEVEEGKTQKFSKKGNFNGIYEYPINLNGQRFIRFNSSHEEDVKSTTTIRSVKLKKRKYNLKIADNAKGSIEIEGEDEVFLGRVVSFKAHPNPGYELTGFKFGNDDRVYGTYRENFGRFTVSQSLLANEKIYDGTNIKIVPVFELITVPVTVKKSEGGKVNYHGFLVDGKTITDNLYNSTFKLTATTEPGKHFAGWNITGIDGLISDNPLYLTLTEKSYSISANFTDARWLTINNDTSRFAYADKGTYKDGDIAVLKSSESHGGNVYQWNDGEQTYAGNIFFTQINGDKTVEYGKPFVLTEKKEFYCIKGRIVDEKGNGIPNMKVMMPSGLSEISETVTDADGFYRFNNAILYWDPVQIAFYDQSGKSGRAGIVTINLSQYTEVLDGLHVVSIPRITALKSQRAFLPIRVQKAEALVSSSDYAKPVTTIEIDEDNMVSVSASVAWNGSIPGHVDFMTQNDEGVITNTFSVDVSELQNPSLVTANFNASEMFSQGEELVVQAVGSSGSTSDIYATGVYATEPVPEVDPNMTKMEDMPFPPDMPLFNSIPEIGLGNFSTSISYEDGAVILYFGVGALAHEKGDGFKTPEDLKGWLMGDEFQSIKDAYADAKAGKFSSGAEMDIEVEVGGKIIWVYNRAKSTEEDGCWEIAGGFLVVDGNGTAKKVRYFFPLGFPLYLSVLGELGAELDLGFERDLNGADKWGFQGELDPMVGLRFAGGVGLEGLLAGEAWVRGDVEGNIRFGSDNDWSIDLGAAFGIAGTVFGILEAEYTIWDEKITIPDSFETPDKYMLMAPMQIKNQTVTDAIYSKNQSITIKPIRRTYLKDQTVMTESPGMPKIKAFGSEGFSPIEEHTLISSTNPASEPQIAKFDDKIIAVYVIDPGSQERPNPLNCTMAVYTMYRWDEKDKKYKLEGKQYCALHDDKTADQNPYVYVTDKSVVVAWASANREFSEGEKFSDIASSYDIQAKFYDRKDEIWSDVYTLTDDVTNYGQEINDSMPRIASYCDESGTESILVVYQKMVYESSEETAVQDDLDIMQKQIALVFRVWDGQKWGPEELINETYLKAEIPTMDMISYDGLGILTYMKDNDSNTNTVNDQEIFLLFYAFPGVLENNSDGGWTKPICMTINEHMDKKPKLALAGNDKSYLFWYSGNKIVYYHLKELFEFGFEQLTVTDDEGKKHEVWALKDGFPPYTAFIDETAYEDNPLGGEMQYYDFTVGEDGNVYILWSEFSKNGSNIYLSACNASTYVSESGEETSQLGVDGLWSKKFKITSGKSIDRSFSSAVADNGNVWIIYNKVTANIDEDEIDKIDWKYDREKTDLCLSMFEPFFDFDVEIQKDIVSSGIMGTLIEGLTFGLVNMDKINATVNIKNTGIFKVDVPIEVTLSAYKSDKKKFEETRTINPPIAGGETASVVFSVPYTEGLTLKASAVKKSEVKSPSGAMKMSLFAEEPVKTDEYQIPSLSSIKVTAKETVFEDGKYTFGALVTNNGVVSSADTVLTLRVVNPQNDTLNELLSVDIGKIEPGEYKDITFEPVEIKQNMFDSSNIAQLFIDAVSGEDSSKCEILISNIQRDTETARNIFIDKSAISMYPGQIEILNATLYPSTAKSTIEWSSSDSSVAAVTKNSGFISAVSPGEAIITVTAIPEGITKECTIRVRSASSKTKKDKKDQDTTVSFEDGIKKTIINVDFNKINNLLEDGDENGLISIKNQSGTEALKAKLDVEALKKMKKEDAVMRLETGGVTYTIPAKAIDLEADLWDDAENATVSVEVSPMADDEATKLQEDLENGGYTIVAPPVSFEVTCNVGEKKIKIDKFSSYVERTIAIPDGMDPADVTTGAVVNPDGTLTHVPTKVVEKDGRYYAVINSLSNSTYVLIKNTVNFSDIGDHWAADVVKEMGNRKIVNGVGEDRFAPDASVTRAMFAVMAVRALGLNERGGRNVFSDAAESDWFFGAVGNASDYGLMGGYADGTFRPDVCITREEAMAVIARASKLTGLDAEFDATILNQFSDRGQVSEWARDAAASCVGLGIVTGSSGEIRPKDMITRAEAAAMIMRLLNKADLI